MSTAEFEQPEFQPDPMHVALTDLDATQAFFIEKVERWANLPIKSRLGEVSEATQGCEQSFMRVMETILDDPETSNDEKAKHISTVFLGIDATRVASFKKIAPYGDFTEIAQTHTDFTKKLQEWFNEGAASEDLLEQMRGVYIKGVTTDAVELMHSIPARRFLDKVEAAGKHAGDVGKIILGVYVGGLLSKRLSNKRNNDY